MQWRSICYCNWIFIEPKWTLQAQLELPTTLLVTNRMFRTQIASLSGMILPDTEFMHHEAGIQHKGCSHVIVFCVCIEMVQYKVSKFQCWYDGIELRWRGRLLIEGVWPYNCEPIIVNRGKNQSDWLPLSPLPILFQAPNLETNLNHTKPNILNQTNNQ